MLPGPGALYEIQLIAFLSTVPRVSNQIVQISYTPD